MNADVEVTVIRIRHVKILMHHSVVNATKVLLEMEQIAQVVRMGFFTFCHETECSSKCLSFASLIA